VLVLSIYSIGRGCRGPTAFSREQLDRLETNAEFSAQETADFLGDRTDVMLVYLDVPGSVGLIEVKDAFINVLTANGKNIIGEEVFRPVEAGQFFNPIGWAYLLEDFADMVSRHPPADVIVTLAGTPVFDPDAIDDLPDSFPPIVAGFFLRVPGDVGAWFDSGRLEMAIMRSSSQGEAEPTTPREKYDRIFKTFTADSTEPLPMPMMM